MTTNRSDDDLLVKQVGNLTIKTQINPIAELMTMNRSPRDADDHLLVEEAEKLTTKDNEGSQYRRRYELSDQVFPLSPAEAVQKLEDLRVLIGSEKMKKLPDRRNRESFTFSENTSRFVRKVDVLSVDKGLKGLNKTNSLILSTLIDLLIENLEKSPSTSPFLFLRTLYYMFFNKRIGVVYPNSITIEKDKLKDFFSLLIQSSLSSSKNNFSVSGEHVPDKHGHMKTIRPHQISVELVSNAALYEQSVLYIAWITWRKTLIGCGLSWSRFEKSYFSYTTMPRVLS